MSDICTFTSMVMPNGKRYEVKDTFSRDRIIDVERRLQELESKEVDFVELSCKNCGGKIQQKYHDPIFKCPYCKTVYAIGYKQVNAS